MMRQQLLALAALPALALPVLAQQPEPAGATTAFVDVSVIPMDRERVLANQTVVVRDGRIVAVGPAASYRDWYDDTHAFTFLTWNYAEAFRRETGGTLIS